MRMINERSCDSENSFAITEVNFILENFSNRIHIYKCNYCFKKILFLLIRFRYKISNDPAGWLTINRETGQIKIRNSMDRESSYVKDGKYRTTILALDDDGNFCLFLEGLFLLA